MYMSESNDTKKAIADSLIKLCKERPFDKITVRDISEDCGVNRQTFYYHFMDKFDLLEWIYIEQLLNSNLKDVSFDNWVECLTKTLNCMKDEQRFYVNTINHAEDYIRKFALKHLEKVFTDAIDQLDENNHVDDTNRRFISRFFAHGISGIIIEWVEHNMDESPEFIAGCMQTLLISCEKAAYNHVKL